LIIFNFFFHLVSYNEPQFNSNATWDACGITRVSKTMIGQKPRVLFINTNDTIYVADYNNNRILIWFKGNIDPIHLLTVQLYGWTSPFVTTNGDIYFEIGNETGRIDRWMVDSNSTVVVVKFPDSCIALFIDIHNYVYCSMFEQHKVMKLPLDGSVTIPIEVAGTSTPGSGPAELNGPFGIFVDTNMDLYVADKNNHRIQVFRQSHQNGITVAGDGIPNNLRLSFPQGVTLDGNGYLYIADTFNHRIIRAGHDDFQCIAGCTGQRGSSSSELNYPCTTRFDSLGNFYVADEYNNRIQKFHLSTTSCSKCDMNIDLTLIVR
jgi:hypothetical protein